ncbi:hypothetical protein [Massilia rubra]|uniref:Transmembrane protein n=1 Tax=Massilia rubra TaxID=2607910 RepID=A0ABX0M0B4_9BURK|nr:hypothetical protein [Massilia rubra]NHZ37772.1 hypothetical protein [Massilia rubra]
MHVPLSPPPPRPLAQMLLHAALIAWGVSLLLPAFTLEGKRWPDWGLDVMLDGLVLGWMVNGWAVYANVFFAIGAVRVRAGKPTGYAIGAMLLLAATLPFLKGSYANFSSGTVWPVVSWGWGAFLWLVSLVLLAAAARAKEERLARRGAVRFGLAILLACVAALALHGYQWWHANEPDRQALLSNGMIFTVSELCPFALAWPAPLDGSTGEAVVLDIDPLLRSSDGVKLDLPAEFTDEQGDGSAWRVHRVEGTSSTVMVREKAQAGSLVLQFKAEGKDAVMRLLKGVPQRVLYEQRLHEVASAKGDVGFCPLLGRSRFSQRDDYDKALMRAMALDPPIQEGTPLPRAEEAREPCDFGTADIDRIKGLRNWDGREVMIWNASQHKVSGFCSASYMVLVYHGAPPHEPALWQSMYVYDRKTLNPLAVFSRGDSCPDTMCGPGVAVTVQAIALDGRKAVIQTTLGSYSATMDERF